MWRRVKGLSIFWRVFVLDALLLITAGVLIAFTPITISAPIERSQALVLSIGVAVFVAANGFLLWLTLRPLRRLVVLMNAVDLREPGRRLEIDGASEVSTVIDTFNHTLERLEAERRDSSTVAIRAQEAERMRIARDLHDEVGQNLTGILLFLRRAEQGDPAERAEALAAAQETARAAIHELRNVDRRLRPSTLDELGLPSALEALAETFELRTATPVALDVDDSIELRPGALPGALPDRAGGAHQRRPPRRRHEGQRDPALRPRRHLAPDRRRWGWHRRCPAGRRLSGHARAGADHRRHAANRARSDRGHSRSLWAPVAGGAR